MKLDPKLQAQLGQMFAAPEGENELNGSLVLVDISKIQTEEQPRKNFDSAALVDLENSIRSLHEDGKGVGGSGILQPLLVRVGEQGSYVVTAGERRLRAAKAAGLKQIPVIVDTGNDEDAWEQAVIENLIREDLSPLEEASAIQKLMHSRGYSVREAAKRLGKDKGYLENRLFLTKAPEDVQDMVSARADTVRHAREISKIENAKDRRKLIQSVIDGASFGTIQAEVQRILASKKISAPGVVDRKQTANEDTRRLSEKRAALTAIVKDLKTAGRVLPHSPQVRAEMATELEKQVAELQRLIQRLRS